MFERDKGNIHAEKRDFVPQHIRGNIADVCALHIDHALIGAQAPRQLAIAHIHGVHFDCAIFEHTVGKAACRCANIHADLAIRPHGEHLHGFFQLEAAAADVTDIMAAHFHFGVLSNHFTGFVHFLLIDKDNTGHDQCFGALPALGIAVLAKVLIQTNFH